MFWFRHPPPPSRKPVAEQVVARKQAALVSLTTIVVETPAVSPERLRVGQDEELVPQPPIPKVDPT